MADKDEVVRVMLTKDAKADYKEFCQNIGQSMSERLRMLAMQDMASNDAASRFDAIMAFAAKKNSASGLRTPSIDEINAFVDKVREERIQSAMVL